MTINFLEIYFLLTHFNKKNFYKDFASLLLGILSEIKLVIFNFFKIKKKYDHSNFIIFSKHKLVDQINFSEISNFLLKNKKKHLVVLNHKKKDFSKIANLYKTKNIINLKNYLNIFDILIGLRNFFKYLN